MSSATPRSAKVFCNGLPRRAETVVLEMSWPAPAGAGDRNAVSASVRGAECRLAPHRHNSLSVPDHPASRVPPMAEWTDPMTDDDRRQALLDLLGVLAYGELIAFERLADDARLAPSVSDKAALGAMAVAEFGHFRKLRD